jgi:hypothetical protein
MPNAKGILDAISSCVQVGVLSQDLPEIVVEFIYLILGQVADGGRVDEVDHGASPWVDDE